MKFKNPKKTLIEYIKNANPARLYILVVLLPLILADYLFVNVVLNAEKANLTHEYENDVVMLSNQINNLVENASNFAIEIEMNEELNNFLSKHHYSPYDYLVGYQEVTKNSFLESRGNLYNISPKIFVNNYTIINGGEFGTIESIENQQWYKEFKESGQNSRLIFYYDSDRNLTATPQRHLYFIKKFKTYGTRKKDIVVRIEINYSQLIQNIDSNNYNSRVLLCDQNRILIDSNGDNNIYQDFATLSDDLDIGYKAEWERYGNSMEILSLEGRSDVLELLWKHRFFLLLIIVINAVFPLFVMYLLQAIQSGKLKEQEMDIARQNAELLALHSQINPHFLFNALESIRMHSILRNEEETAEMVEKLAIIERKNADWNVDFISIKNEMEFAEAYLSLQKYRFGDRLNYEINVEKECANFRIPKLTVVTFVENACVHGIEGKSTPGWIFVSVSISDDNLNVEIEDTGEGVSEEELESLRSRIENASIEDLKNKGRIGMINACLRLKMATSDEVSIKVESEQGVGTTVLISIPLKYCKKEDIF